MLHDKQCSGDYKVGVDGVRANFSLASEGTKVSIHALDALLGLIP